MITRDFTKSPNVFVVDLKSNKNNISGDVAQVVTTKIKPHSISASNLKSDLQYNEEDAEVWVFDCGTAAEYIN